MSSSTQKPTAPGRPLFVLAFDHRAVLRDLVGSWTAESVPRSQMVEMKNLVLDALLCSARRLQGLGRRQLGLLIDEEFGSDAARRAHKEGLVLVMPIERSGAPSFTLDFGDGWLEHLERFPVDCAKALVFLNPEGPADAYWGQLRSLAKAMSVVRQRGYRSMLEVVVPPTDKQLSLVDGDEELYDRRLRPGLVRRVIEDCYGLGMRPDLWKLEGLDSTDDASMVARAVTAADKSAACLVLGRGADKQRVIEWLRCAAAAPGFAGFAIGRSIWEAPIREWMLGRIARSEAVQQVSVAYDEFVDAYCRVVGGS